MNTFFVAAVSGFNLTTIDLRMFAIMHSQNFLCVGIQLFVIWILLCIIFK